MRCDLAAGRVAVTGAFGLIGRKVVRLLESRDVQVLSVAQPGSGVAASRRVAVVDLEDPDAIAGLFEGCIAVIHLAARAGGIVFQQQADADTFAVNRRLTDNVLAAARSCGVRRAFLASSAVVYAPSDAPVAEDSRKLSIEDRPSQYAWSKITDEVAAAWHADFETVVGRFGNVYGPGAPIDGPGATVVHALVGRALAAAPGSELEVWGDGTAVRSFIYVGDVARAIVHIVEHAPGGSVFNVDSGVPVTIAELASTIRDEVDPALRIRFDPTKPGGLPFRVQDATALGGIGFEPQVGLREGIRRTVAWNRSATEAG